MDISDLVTIHYQEIDSEDIRWVSRELRDKWCRKPYAGYPNGCPNYGKRDSCPPKAACARKLVETYQHFYLVYAWFRIAEFAVRRQARFPKWTTKQLRNPRHWQAQLKRMLREYIANLGIGILGLHSVVLGTGSGFWGAPSMEGACINVFPTLRKAGIAHQVNPSSHITLVALIMTRFDLDVEHAPTSNIVSVKGQRNIDDWLSGGIKTSG